MEKNKNRDRIWDAFLLSGRPGYYMLYKALNEKDKRKKED